MASCLGLGWSHYWIDPSEGRYKIPGMRWESNPTYTNERIRELKRAKALEKQSQEWTADGNWEWESLGFLARTNREFLLLAVPYWSIVFLLTVLSAWLLFFKPPTLKAPSDLKPESPHVPNPESSTENNGVKHG